MSLNSATRGLINLGSTCFLNAALQVISRCENFVQSLELLTKDVNDGLPAILHEVLKEMRTAPFSNPLEPVVLHKWILENTNQFPAGVQGDPLELMEVLIDSLDSLDFSHFEEASVACSKEYHFAEDEFEPADPLGIGLKFQFEATDTRPTSTKELIKKYFYRKTGRKCKYCADGDEVIKKRFFMEPPKTLVMSIGRNCSSGNIDVRSSVKCFADPVLSIPVSNQEPVKYKLIGAIEHEGCGTTSGHFKAVVKDNGIWYCYSDHEITLAFIDPSNVYILVYNLMEENVERMVYEDNEEGCGSQSNFGVPTFSLDEIRDAEGDPHSTDDHGNVDDGSVREFSKRYVESYKYCRLLNSRILLMCIPKQLEGSCFNEKYKNFLKSNLTILYTITSSRMPLYTIIRKDPLIQEHFDIYAKKISSKIGIYHTRRWIAQAATAFIVHSLLYIDGPRFEFIFDLRLNTLLPYCIMAYWESCKTATMTALERIIKNKLFCLNSCNNACHRFKDPFHFSLKGMKQIDFLTEIEKFSTIQMWSFVDNECTLEGHPLEKLLFPLKIDNIVSIATQVSTRFQECDFLRRRKVNVYLLLVVNDAPGHSSHDLKELWNNNSAKFGIYAGLTCYGRYRKHHLRKGDEGEITAVSKFLNATSKVYLVTSKEFDERKDAEEAEAKFIAVLKYFEVMETKTGISKGFDVLNVINSLAPLYNSFEELDVEVQEFIKSGARLFIFHGEVNTSSNDDQILKSYLVEEEIETYYLRDESN